MLCALGLESFEPQTVVRGDVKSEVFRRPRPDALVKRIKPMLKWDLSGDTKSEHRQSPLIAEGL